MIGKISAVILKILFFFISTWNMITFQKWINRRTLKQIRAYLFYGICLHLLASLCTMVLSAYLVSATLFLSPNALHAHLWTGVVILLTAVVMITINLAAFLGSFCQNRMLLIMYFSILGVGFCVFIVVAIISFELSGRTNGELQMKFTLLILSVVLFTHFY